MTKSTPGAYGANSSLAEGEVDCEWIVVGVLEAAFPYRQRL